MASTPVLVFMTPGSGTLTLKLYAPTDLSTVVNPSDTAAEHGTCDGCWSFTVTEALSGAYIVEVEDSNGDCVRNGIVLMRDTTTPCICMGEAGAILREVLIESYATDGAEATLPQLMYMIWSRLAEWRSDGTTTPTCKKLDGTTQAMEFTIDSASQPATITRSG